MPQSEHKTFSQYCFNVGPAGSIEDSRPTLVYCLLFTEYTVLMMCHNLRRSSNIDTAYTQSTARQFPTESKCDAGRVKLAFQVRVLQYPYL